MTQEDKESSRNIIESLEVKEQKNRPLAIRIADLLTSSFGSIGFFVVNAVFFGFWILINSGLILGVPPFDPYPYILLTMVVSLEAIFLSIIVLMSQSRQSYVSTLREELDMQVNLISEREITKVLELQKLILKQLKVNIQDHELDDMLKATDISYIERQLEEQLKPTKRSPKVIRKVEKEIDKVVKEVGI